MIQRFKMIQRNEESGRQKKFGDSELHAILDEDDTQGQKQMAEMYKFLTKSNFQPFKRYGKHSKVWKKGAS